MNSPKPHPSEEDTDNAIAEYLRRIDSGEDIDREAYLANHEASAQELRSFFENENLFRNLLANGPTQSLLDQPPESDGRALTAAIMGLRALPWTQFPTPFGRYRVEKLVGRGAMGSVYQAHDTQLERVVAIKLPHPPSNGKPADRERLLQEAHSAAALVHPNLCRIYDVGTIEGTDYIAMELIEGRSLSSYVHRGQLPSLKSVAMIIRKLASALELAHQHGVIHRDVKPANILIRKSGEPVLMDFGLAQRPLLEGQQRLTQAGTLVGSPAYMAPEQVRGEPNGIGPETDIYGLGGLIRADDGTFAVRRIRRDHSGKSPLRGSSNAFAAAPRCGSRDFRDLQTDARQAHDGPVSADEGRGTRDRCLAKIADSEWTYGAHAPRSVIGQRAAAVLGPADCLADGHGAPVPSPPGLRHGRGDPAADSL